MSGRKAQKHRGSLVELARKAHRSSVKVNDLLDDAHTQSGTQYSSGCVGTEKALANPGYRLRRHAHTLIGNAYLVPLTRWHVGMPDRQNDLATIRRILERVGHHVVDSLRHLAAVALDVRLRDIKMQGDSPAVIWKTE